MSNIQSKLEEGKGKKMGRERDRIFSNRDKSIDGHCFPEWNKRMELERTEKIYSSSSKCFLVPDTY